jgi:hypothetical protein
MSEQRKKDLEEKRKRIEGLRAARQKKNDEMQKHLETPEKKEDQLLEKARELIGGDCESPLKESPLRNQ